MLIKRALLAAAAGALLAGVAPAPAQAQFSAPTPISPAGWPAGSSRQATDRHGDTTFVWAGGGPEGGAIQTRIRRADGSLTAVHKVTDIAYAWDTLDVAVDDDGDGVIVWNAISDPDPPYETTHLWARRVTKGGALGPIRMVSLPSQHSIDAEVAVQPNGGAVIAWNYLDDTSYSPWVRTMGLDSTLGPARQIGAGPNAPAPTVSVDRRGRSLLVWSNWGRLYARRMTASGTLGRTHRIYTYGSDINYDFIGVGLSRRGAPFVVWLITPDDSFDGQVWGRHFTRSLEPTSKARRISKLTQDAVNVQLATDLQGDSVVAWTAHYFAGAFARRVRNDGAMGKVAKLSNASVGPVVLDDDGDGIVVTNAYRNGYRTVIRATRVSHKRDWTFGKTVVIGTNGDDRDFFSAGISATGRATVAWMRFPVDDSRIMAVTGR